MVSKLPDAFFLKMRQMLDFESSAFFNSLNSIERNKGLRVNTLKISSDDFLRKAPWIMEPVPWVKNAFFYPGDAFPASHPLYRAGLFYLQEPSAMTPADRFPVEPGDKVLDLCAAPGGKATALAAKLKGTGLIVANEINVARAKALLYNMEVSGVRNALITNEKPFNLEKRFPAYFDKILVDAPCSGEGMFRKEEQAAATWSEEKVEKCARIQKEILENAVNMLKPGGMLMYSTCTFSAEENEQNVCRLLEHFPCMHLVQIEGYEGFSEGIPVGSPFDGELKKAVRIWPHKMRGEGHFLALFKKDSEEKEEMFRGRDSGKRKDGKRKDGKRKGGNGRLSREDRKFAEQFFSGSAFQPDLSVTENRGGRLFTVPDIPESAYGIRFLRNGLYLGDIRKNRFEPSQALACTLSCDIYRYSIDLMQEPELAESFLNGGNISTRQACDIPDKSWILVTAEGFGLAWCKKNGEILKNKYLWHT